MRGCHQISIEGEKIFGKFKKNHKITLEDQFMKMKFHFDPRTIFDSKSVHYFDRSSGDLDPLSRASMMGLENIWFVIRAVHNPNLY